MTELAQVDPSGPLTQHESTQLEACEQAIESGARTFIRVGECLAVIRDQRLYRETHGSFESYCEERWGFSRRRGYQLIRSAEAASEAVRTTGSQLNERQARELAKIEPERRGEVLERAQSGGDISARSIREAAAESSSPPDSASVADDVVRDAFGRIVPDIFPDAQVAFAERDVCKDARSAVARVMRELDGLRDHPAMAFVSWGDVDQAINALRIAFRANAIDPYTISPLGGGSDDELSRGTGWLPYELYMRAVPAEIREEHEAVGE